MPEMDFSSLFSFEKLSDEGLTSNIIEQSQLQFWEAQWKIGTLYSKGNKQIWLKTLKCKAYSLLPQSLSQFEMVFFYVLFNNILKLKILNY